MSEKINSAAGFGTLLIHAGEAPDPQTGSVAPVLVRSKTYAQKEFGVEPEFQYSRGNNPTRKQLEQKLEALEAYEGHATVFGSGVAAEASFLLTLKPGDHVLFCQEVYGGTFRLVDGLLKQFGIDHSFADFSNETSIRNALRSNTRYLWVETPTNPSFHVIDLAFVDSISKATGIPWVADMTFSPPCSTRAFEYGAETVIHSLSKYIAGHNDILGGAVITRNKTLYERLRFMQRTIGAVLSPDECYRVLQGIKTLELRWAKVSENAALVAEFLSTFKSENDLSIEKVFYPGLQNHPGYEIAARQMKNGFGGVLSFSIGFKKEVAAEDRFKKLKKFVDDVRQKGIIIYGESLASPETILAYPPLMSHKSIPKEARESLGITDGFFRLSLGFEDPTDIIESLKDGLR